MKIVVGAPVYERGWILDHWFEGVVSSLEHIPGDVEATLLLNYAPSEDNTYDIIGKWTPAFESVELVYDMGEDHEEPRRWRYDRYVTMCRLRNRLLEEVRKAQPDFYLSCDTDMLLQPDTLYKLIDESGPYAGIAPLTYMTPKGLDFPNAMMEDFFRRPKLPEELGEVVPVSVCFGTVLMKPSLYNEIDYAPDPLGEDVGWGKRAGAAGLGMALHTGAKVKHVMRRPMLREVDPRVGY